MKIAVLGCGLRTPLLIHGLGHSGLNISRLELYDTNATHAQVMTELGRILVSGGRMQLAAAESPLTAIDGSSFVISSIRVGDMETRARDERLAISCGLAGQETTGPAGFAMALRTVPAAIEYARMVERTAPNAWIVNFTNPAGLITQAISKHSGARVIGICDTPVELVFRIANALNQPMENIVCDYVGLNHLGWIRSVRVVGQDVTKRVLEDDVFLEHLYPAKLFSPSLIRALQLIPTEYLFFYYSQRRAFENQRRTNRTRGEELLELNRTVWAHLEAGVRQGNPAEALRSYRSYLNRRNASYMRLEGEAGSALDQDDPGWDPFEGATGYHRIAVETIQALLKTEPSEMILNSPNGTTLAELQPEDVVELPCLVNCSGAVPMPVKPLPESVIGLTLAVKTFERLTIQAAVERSSALAALALFTNPIVRDWDTAVEFCEKLKQSDPAFRGFR
jgi:6-phospho-beta-glucosidase